MQMCAARSMDGSINHKFGHCVMQLIVMLGSASDKLTVYVALRARFECA